MKELIDKFNNVITWDGRDIYLKFKNDHGRRWLGWFEHGAFHTKRALAKHEFTERKAIGFNYNLLKNAKFTRLFVHCDDGRIFEALVEDILRDGKTMQFSKKGFELQVFYPVDKFRDVRALVEHLGAEPA